MHVTIGLFMSDVHYTSNFPHFYHIILILLHLLGFLHVVCHRLSFYNWRDDNSSTETTYLVCHAMPATPHWDILLSQSLPVNRSPDPSFYLAEFLVCPTIITFFLFFHTQTSLLLLTILSVFSSAKSSGESLTLFLFKNFISLASTGFSPVITMHKKHINYWLMHWIVTKTINTIFQMANRFKSYSESYTQICPQTDCRFLSVFDLYIPSS